MKRILQIATLFVMLFVSAAAPGYAQLSEVSVGSNQSVEIDRHGICKVVKNLHPSNALYVPSMSRDEWVNFLSVPPWREVSECKSCSGYARDGYCFYGGAEYQSCNSVCSARGGVNASGMNKLSSQVRISSIEANENLFGGQLMLAGGGTGALYYCQVIARVVLGASTSSGIQLRNKGTWGCGMNWYGSRPTVFIDNGWNGANGYPVGKSRQVCACNR